MKPPFAVSEEVRDAVATGRPVVALETVIVTHGLPRPTNVEVALDAEHALRAAGVVPATIGVVDGVATVGLCAAEVRRLGTADDVVKLSGRDLPVAVARGANGGTTVAATALLAHRAGIGVFATGGLGGVHRGASATFDESADLVTLAGVPILVVSAGVKSILDIGATLERLETLAVTVLGYRTDTFPGFYVRDSGFTVPERVESPDEVAAVLRARDALGLRSAVLLANPVTTAAQLDPDVHDRVLDEALADAASAGVRGNATTPHLLDHMRRATEGASLAVNLAAYHGNVALAGEVALARAVPSAATEGTAHRPERLSRADRDAVAGLVLRHGHLVDAGELERLDELFTPDVRYDVRDVGGGVLVGIAAIVEASLALGAANPVAHHVTDVVVTDPGDGTARVRSTGLGVRVDGSCGSVVYDDVVVPTDAGWRISHRTVLARRTPLGGRGASRM